MKYFLETIRRRSKNNGINFCQYWVIKSINTDEIVYDGSWNINQKDSKPKAEHFCNLMNSGEIKTRFYERSDGTKGEEIDWDDVWKKVRNQERSKYEKCG